MLAGYSLQVTLPCSCPFFSSYFSPLFSNGSIHSSSSPPTRPGAFWSRRRRRAPQIRVYLRVRPATERELLLESSQARPTKGEDWGWRLERRGEEGLGMRLGHFGEGEDWILPLICCVSGRFAHCSRERTALQWQFTQ